jgi:transcription elongation factor Elf1
MNPPRPVIDDEFFGRDAPDFRFLLRFAGNGSDVESKSRCALCGDQVSLCCWARLELFYEPSAGRAQLVCEACGRRYAPQLLAARDAYRRISDPCDTFAVRAHHSYAYPRLALVDTTAQAAAERLAQTGGEEALP